MKNYFLLLCILSMMFINCEKKNETRSTVSLTNKDYDPKKELKEEAIFNIDLFSKRYQPAHIEICKSNGFVIFGKFSGSKPIFSKYRIDTIKFVTRNLFPLDTLNYEIMSINDSIISDDKINLKINIRETDDAVQMEPKFFVFPKSKNKVKKNCLLDISIFLNGTKYNPCNSGLESDSPRMQNIGGHACKMYLVY